MSECPITMSRVWAMPHRYTFRVGALRDIVLKYKQQTTAIWLDPFAGQYSPAEITNDLDPKLPTLYHLEAADFVQAMIDAGVRYGGAVFDPPYSLTQVSRSYAGIGLRFTGKENPTGGFPRVRDLLTELLPQGAYVVSFGWNTVGMGKKRGWEPIEYLICSHGGNRNDTLVTVERKG